MPEDAEPAALPQAEKRVPVLRRRRARECIVEALYQTDLVQDEPEKAIREAISRKKLAASVIDFCFRLLRCVVAEQSAIDAILAPALKKWKLERLSYVDRAILRMATGELLFLKETPPVVVISEAVELAKRYSGLEAGRFVNGVLDAVARRYCGSELDTRKKK